MGRMQFFFIGCVIYAAVGISALMSAHYGYTLAGEGSEEYERYILAGAFGIFAFGCRSLILTDIIFVLFFQLTHFKVFKSVCNSA